MFTNCQELKNQAFWLLHQLDEEKLKAAVDLLRVIKSDGQLRIHSFDGTLDKHCYTNIPEKCLKVTKDHPKIGPHKKYLIPPIHKKMLSTYILDDSIINRGIKFNPENFQDCVLKSSDKVLIRGGDKVVYKGYIFYTYYCGYLYLYVTKEDYEKDKDIEDFVSRRKTSFFVSCSDVQKIVPIKDLEYELEEYRKRYEVNRHDYSSSGEWS